MHGRTVLRSYDLYFKSPFKSFSNSSTLQMGNTCLGNSILLEKGHSRVYSTTKTITHIAVIDEFQTGSKDAHPAASRTKIRARIRSRKLARHFWIIHRHIEYILCLFIYVFVCAYMRKTGAVASVPRLSSENHSVAEYTERNPTSTYHQKSLQIHHTNHI